MRSPAASAISQSSIFFGSSLCIPIPLRSPRAGVGFHPYYLRITQDLAARLPKTCEERRKRLDTTEFGTESLPDAGRRNPGNRLSMPLPLHRFIYTLGRYSLRGRARRIP